MLRLSSLILLVFFALPALAGPREDISAGLSKALELDARLRKLADERAEDRADPTVQVAAELNTLREWLTEAQERLRDESQTALQRSLERARAQIELVEALVARAEASHTARQAREQADRVEREATEQRRVAAKQEEARAMLEQQEAAQRTGNP